MIKKITFSKIWLICILGIGVLIFHYCLSYAQTNEGTIETEIQYDNGKKVDFNGLVVKIYQDFSATPYLLLDSIPNNPYKISGLTLDHHYTVQVFRQGMYSGENTLDLKTDSDKLLVKIFRPIRISVDVYYKDGQTPIKEARVLLTSSDGVPAGEGITGNGGKTSYLRLQPTTRVNENYVANISINKGISFNYSPIFLRKGTTNSDIKIVTPWPSFIDNLITVQLYHDDLRKFSPVKENFVVELYNSSYSKVAESKVNQKGVAFFSNMKVDTYDFRVIKKEAPKDTEWGSMTAVLDGSQNEVKITESPTMIILESNQTGTKISETENANNKTNPKIIIPTPKFNIALVEPSFTNAAYKNHAFYTFYAKYGFPPNGTQITKDLDLLTSTIPHGPFRSWDQKESEYDRPIRNNYFISMGNQTNKILPDSRITEINDRDVHLGRIFDSNGKNLFDLIILFHQEYVTNEEYHNFKKFVENGGTIFFAMSNMFTTEVTYSEKTDSITLVKGHNWEFDGKIAKPSVPERWVEETKDWVGSNFLTDPIFTPIQFTDPFDYKHIEEQYTSNPNDIILLDHQVKYPTDHKFNPVVASYEIHHGKGKAISSSIWSSSVAENRNLWDFYDNIIFPRAVGSVTELKTKYGVFPIYWLSQSIQVSQIDFNENEKRLDISLSGKNSQGDTLRIVIPKDLLGEDPLDSLKMVMNNKTMPYEFFSDDIETGFNIPITENGDKIQMNQIKPTSFSKFLIQQTVESFKFSHNYQCVPVSSVYHCDYEPNEILAYNARSNSTEVYSSLIKPSIFMKGIKGGALELRAPRMESLEIPKSGLTVPSQFSISFFVKPSDDSEPFGVIISNIGMDKKSGWFFDMTSKNGTQSLSFNIFTDQGLFKIKDIPIPQGNFTNIVATFDGKSVRIYKDAFLSNEIEVTGNYQLPDTAIRMGSQAWSFSTQRWSGIIDELYFYSKVLGNDELRDLSTLSAAIPKDNLIFYFPFDNDGRDYSNNKLEAQIRTLIPSMAFTPDGRLLFSEKNTGNIRIMKDDKVMDEPFFHINDYLVSWEQGILGLTIDPKFEQNHFVYLYYVYQDQETGKVFNRVIRIVDAENHGGETAVILDKIYAEKGYHSGGAMAFGGEDKLYITVGDATEHPFAEDPNILSGKVLRINRDGTIPYDNPFPNSPVYSIGHRNMFGIAFDNEGFGIVTENGDVLYDEIDTIKKGADYGFPFFEEPNLNPFLFNTTRSTLPLLIFYNTPAPTQAIYYDGKEFPELSGKFLFCSFDGHIFALDVDNATKTIKSYQRIFLNPPTIEPAIGLAKSPDGEIYYSGYSIHKLIKTEKESDSFLFNVKVKSNSDSIPYDKIDIIPSKNQISLGSGEGQEIPNLIEIPTSINQEITTISDKDLHQYNFVTFKTPASETMKFLVNYNVTSSYIQPSIDNTQQEKGITNTNKNPLDSFGDWLGQTFHLS